MMTKKDYVKFADMIAESKLSVLKLDSSDYKAGSITNINIMKQKMIALFKSDNPNFDETRFNEYIERKVKSLTE